MNIKPFGLTLPRDPRAPLSLPMNDPAAGRVPHLFDLATYSIILNPDSPVRTLATHNADMLGYSVLRTAILASLQAAPRFGVPAPLVWQLSLMAAVLAGMGPECPTVPCLFWSNHAAYDTAAANLSRTGYPVDMIARTTRQLRFNMFKLGAFPGWLDQDPFSPASAVPLFRAIGLGPGAAFAFPLWSPVWIEYEVFTIPSHGVLGYMGGHLDGGGAAGDGANGQEGPGGAANRNSNSGHSGSNGISDNTHTNTNTNANNNYTFNYNLQMGHGAPNGLTTDNALGLIFPPNKDTAAAAPCGAGQSMLPHHPLGPPFPMHSFSFGDQIVSNPPALAPAPAPAPPPAALGMASVSSSTSPSSAASTAGPHTPPPPLRAGSPLPPLHAPRARCAASSLKPRFRSAAVEGWAPLRGRTIAPLPRRAHCD